MDLTVIWDKFAHIILQVMLKMTDYYDYHYAHDHDHNHDDDDDGDD